MIGFDGSIGWAGLEGLVVLLSLMSLVGIVCLGGVVGLVGLVCLVGLVGLVGLVWSCGPGGSRESCGSKLICKAWLKYSPALESKKQSMNWRAYTLEAQRSLV